MAMCVTICSAYLDRPVIQFMWSLLTKLKADMSMIGQLTASTLRCALWLQVRMSAGLFSHSRVAGGQRCSIFNQGLQCYSASRSRSALKTTPVRCWERHLLLVMSLTKACLFLLQLLSLVPSSLVRVRPRVAKVLHLPSRKISITIMSHSGSIHPWLRSLTNMALWPSMLTKERLALSVSKPPRYALPRDFSRQRSCNLAL